jgi:5'-nucleotidase
MKILLTNDDGFFAPGIRAMAKALIKENHEVIMVAPEFENSGKSHSITLAEELNFNKVKIKDVDCECFSVSGTPADSVRTAIHIFGRDYFDYCFSGVNLGYNAGMDILYSGTVSAAIEANMFGLNSIAVSAQYGREKTQFSAAAKVAIDVFNKLHDKTSQVEVLNVNVPKLPFDEIKGVKVCKVGGTVTDQYKCEKTENGYKLSLDLRAPSEDIDKSDRFYLAKDFATVTPLIYDLNNMEEIETLSQFI